MLSLWPNGIRCWSRVMPSSHVRPQLNIRSIQVSPPRPTARQASTPHHLQESPYAAIPLSLLLRSLVTASFISSPRLMPIALFILSRLAYSNKPFWSPDTNPLLRYTLKHTIYRQFCAGENPGEVTRTIQTLKYLGFSGVMLSYSKEFEFSVEDTRPAAASPSKNGESAQSMDEERIWMDGNLRSVELAQPHDFVALKLTGAGRKTGLQLANGLPPTGEICGAIDVICSLAAKRGAKIVFDAEQAAVQSAINDLALTFMRKFNLDPSRPIVYLTYQAYLKATPDLLSKHLMAARDGQFSLGVKLVRGAYLDSDPRHSIHETKADTDRAFNGLAVGVLMQKWTDMLVGHGDFPTVSLVLATHNQNDVELAQSIVKAGKAKSHLSYAQLQGMADEVSFGLLKAAAKDTGTLRTETPEVYKYIAWGSVGDCLKYLLRRAEENRDAIQRVRRSRDAIWSELFRRLRAAVRLAPSS